MFQFEDFFTSSYVTLLYMCVLKYFRHISDIFPSQMNTCNSAFFAIDRKPYLPTTLFRMRSSSCSCLLHFLLFTLFKILLYFWQLLEPVNDFYFEYFAYSWIFQFGCVRYISVICSRSSVDSELYQKFHKHKIMSKLVSVPKNTLTLHCRWI